MPYIGVSPQFGVRRKHTYTATAGQTSFSGTGSEGATLSYTDSNFVDVYQNGVKLGDADYTSTSGTAIVLAQGASVNDLVEIIVFDAFSAADTVSKADGGTFDGNVTMAGTLGVTGATTLTGGVSGNTTFSNNVTVTGDLASSTSGTSNFRAGVNAGNSIASGGNYNTVVGDEAGTAISTGDNNTFVGYVAGDAVTTGTESVAVGSNALSASVGADKNTALGAYALRNDTEGESSVAVGHQALNAQNFTSATSAYNVAVGANAGVSLTTGEQNVFIGGLAGDACTDDDHNTFVGYNAGGAVNGGFRNTFIGKSAGDAVTTGDKNIIIGTYNGNESSLDIRTASNYVVLSDGDGNVAAYRIGNSGGRQWHLIADADSDIGFAIKNQTSANPYGVSIQFTNEANNDGNQYFLVCTDSSASRLIIYNNGNVVNTNNSYGAISDEKLKEQITDTSSQWEDIKALKIRKYKMKEEVSAKGDSDDLWRLGVVAQELETAKMNGLVEETVDRDEKMKDLGTTTKSVKYSVLYMKAVKALQEAMTRIEALEADVKALKGE